MFSLLLPVIYIAFISLGLPDSILGAAWPVMGKELNAPLEAAGIISMLIAGGTIISSLMSNILTKKLGAGLVTTISVAMTAAALAGFSFAQGFIALCLWAVPYGLGAGAVDAALNNFVALHYKARHMSWLHCFWGIGASTGPYILGFFLTKNTSWQGGYRAISFIQIILTALLVISLPIWKKVANAGSTNENENTLTGGKKKTSVLKIKGVPFILFAFFGYCAMESSTGLWASSYLVNFRGIAPEIAARFASFFYLGITAGRLFNGFIAEKIGDKNMIRIGTGISFLGIILLALPLNSNFPALTGLIIIGLGCAPIYPSIIHATPANFGKENSQAIVGIQMASAYAGSTFMPPLFGLIASHIGIVLYPFYLIIFATIITTGTEILNKIKKQNIN
ncbi:MAG: MFS transporter [Treponemataceae bacterium]